MMTMMIVMMMTHHGVLFISGKDLKALYDKS